VLYIQEHHHRNILHHDPDHNNYRILKSGVFINISVQFDAGVAQVSLRLKIHPKVAARVLPIPHPLDNSAPIPAAEI